MIGILEIVGSTNKLLSENFPKIPIATKDVEQGFERPCFYTDWKGVTSGSIGESLDDESFMLVIYYFPEEPKTNTVELLKMQKILKKLFGLALVVKDGFIIPIGEKTFNAESGKVLSMEMMLRYIQEIPEDEGYLIQDLEVKL